LNGIAFDPEGVRMFVTGKRWPSVFEIYTDPLDYPPVIVEANPISPVWVHIDTPVLLSVIAEDGGPADSLTYIWSINGVIDKSAEDSSYLYSSPSPTVDTVAVKVTDGVFSDSTSWLVYVEIAGVGDDVVSGGDGLSKVRLAQNSPNPFAPSTTIRFTLPDGSGLGRRVRLTVHDVAGRTVATLIDSDLPPGDHSALWDGRDNHGKRVSPGVYLCVLTAGNTTLSRKMTMVE
jgi:hypothetical protein